MRDLPEFARQIVVQCTSDQIRIVIDGEMFPFATNKDGWRVEVDKNSVPTVWIGIVAERVVVDHALASARPIADLPPVPVEIAEVLHPLMYLEPKE